MANYYGNLGGSCMDSITSGMDKLEEVAHSTIHSYEQRITVLQKIVALQEKVIKEQTDIIQLLKSDKE